MVSIICSVVKYLKGPYVESFHKIHSQIEIFSTASCTWKK